MVSDPEPADTASRASSPGSLPTIGAVAIGRNEGERLRRCLESIVGRVSCVVYVDSGSTDGSVEVARALGVDVVELDLTKPFTMARGRNAGFARLREIAPDLPFVQFVDGDCEVIDGWLAAAAQTLDEHADVAAVCGHRYERHPDATIYNRLTDMDWRGPAGEVRFCGGDILARTDAFEAVDGYRDELIAGEDPEICIRLRQGGWKLRRIDQPMTMHDAAMTRFGQWWQRAIRTGHAYAEGAYLHGAPPERFNVASLRSVGAWGVIVPAGSLLAATAGLWWPPLAIGAALGIGMWTMQMFRIAGQRRRDGDPIAHAILYAFFCLLAKIPGALGALRFFIDEWRGRRSGLIEYKDA